jgi:hypothetical protein
VAGSLAVAQRQQLGSSSLAAAWQWWQAVFSWLLFVFAPAISVATSVFVATTAADIPESVEKQVLGFHATIENKLLLL